ncbi:hypothetical protein RclHR1_28250001 [Rhizophagus clarus]|uniref:Uncharacterized protein n=1 Tax=Rhizophagus clarus TaxID=94130 RepID=A0A2Z6RFF5_9GLOM|nr:hypothetical protein RclHR1_28250001 [Rhizophagus clarus]
MCEYLHTNIIAGANAILPARTVGNDHTPKLPKDLETLIQHYRFLNRVLHSVKLLRKYPHTFSSSHDRKWSGLTLLKEKNFRIPLSRLIWNLVDQNFDTDISSFINSALSRSRRRIVLDRVFIDHPTTPQLLTDPKDISVAVTNHFQHAVPIKSSPLRIYQLYLIDGVLRTRPWILFLLIFIVPIVSPFLKRNGSLRFLLCPMAKLLVLL